MNKSLLEKLNYFILNKNHKNTFSIFLVIFSVLNFNAQVASYSFSEANSGLTYPAITGGTVVASGSITNSSVPSAAIGFTFNFNGVDYTTCNISDNGYITFGGTAPASSYATPIAVNSTYNGAISAYSYDLINASSGTGYSGLTSDVTYNTSGTVGSRVFVVQYRNMIRKNGLTKYSGLLNMQIRLNEGSNTVEVWYDAFNQTSPPVAAQTPSTSTSGWCQVGLRGTSITDFNVRTATTTWPVTTAGTLSATIPINATLYNPNVTKFLWTPPCYGPVANSLTASVAINSLVTWTEPSPKPSSYNYEVRYSGAFGSGSTGLFSSGSVPSPASGTPNFTASGLTVGVTYTIYVQSLCGGTVVSTTVIPPCSVATIPYTQNFESALVPAMPPCNSTTPGTGAAFVTIDNSATAYYGFNNKNLITTGALASDTWFFTQKINFPTAGSYRLSYKYGGTRELPQFVQKLKVAYGAVNSSVGMTTLLADHNSIKLSPLTNVINFTVSTPGEYYIGFYGYADLNNGFLQIDDINLDVSSCKPPINLVSGQVTSNSAIISWTPPNATTNSGYQYLVVPSPATPPINTTLPTGTTAPGETLINLLGLTPSTTYSYWVRTDCGNGDVSEWSQVGTFTTLVQLNYCSPSSAQNTTYYSNVVTTGGIANISNVSGYSTGGYGVYTTQVASQSPGNTINFNFGFTGATLGVGIAIWVDWNKSGDFSSAERMYNTTAYIFANSASCSFTVPAGQAYGDYRMRMVIDYWSTNPNDPCANITRGEFEDYTFRVVPPPPSLTINSSNFTICAGDQTQLINVTTPLSNFQVYSWTPSIGVSGSVATGFTFSPSVTTTYTLTATQTSGNFSSNTVKYTVYVNQPPTPIAISPNGVYKCQNDSPVQLVASGGIVTGSVVFEENFNGTTTIFTPGSNSSGGTPALADWTLRPSPYNRNGNISSNDNSQFYFSDSDRQGPAGTTNTWLVSPTFSLASPITNASFSFWHYYRGWSSGTACVQISLNNGASYTTIPISPGSPTPDYSWTTTSTGSPTAFSHVVIDLSPYIGNSNVKIRFAYLDAKWGWYWAIDNVKLTVSTTSEITWDASSLGYGVYTGLYLDSAGTQPYNGLITSTVYASPTSNSTYYASAVSPEGCNTQTEVLVRIRPISGGVASSNQSLCSGTPANLTLTGYTGTILKWQYSNTLAFTTSVDIPSSNSSTLTSAQMGVLTADRYYRAVVTNSNCTAYSNIIKIAVSVPTNWNGASWVGGTPDSTKSVIFDDSYSSNANLNACSVKVNSGNIVFNSGHNLIVQNNVNVAGGTLRFEDSASLVQINDNAVNTGNIIYKRNTTPVKKYDYTYWSSPVASQTLFALSPNTLADKYFAYDPAVDNWAFTPSSTNMALGKGYIVRSPNNFDPVTTQIFNAQFTGVPNNGVITTPITLSSSGIAAYNLIGNPYPSAINVDSFFNVNGSGTGTGVVEKTIYLWTHNTSLTNNLYTDNDYATYNYMGGVGTAHAPNSGVNNSDPLGKVAAGQSFFIKGLIAGNATFNNSMRVVGNNNQFFKNADPSLVTAARSRVWLEMFNNQGAYKQTLVGYTAAATAAYDDGYDGELFDGGTSILFYSLLSPVKLAIQGKGMPFSDQDLVPLGYQVNASGNYQIGLSNFDGIFDTQNVYLEDKSLNVIHNLKESNYSFTTDQGIFDTRFVLRYTDGSALSNNSNSITENRVVVYKNKQDIHINTGAIAMDEVSIYDVRGSLMYAKKGIHTTDFKITDLASSQQMILIQIKTVEGNTVTKKLIF